MVGVAEGVSGIFGADLGALIEVEDISSEEIDALAVGGGGFTFLVMGLIAKGVNCVSLSIAFSSDNFSVFW
jgi:hypothetical protein